jgi:pimeloyl-ACP methyl ester carboxylesterase
MLRLDMPGHGDNDQSVEKTNTVDYMHQPLSGSKYAGLSSFHLAGSSMGGWISMLYAPVQVSR